MSESTVELNPAYDADRAWTACFERSAVVCAAIVAALGVAGLTGWVLEIGALKGVLPGWATMKPNTALGFILAGASLAVACRPQAALGWRRAHTGLALCVALLGLLTLAEYMFGIELGIDELIFPVPHTGATHPGRMASATAAGFTFTGVALVLLDSGQRALVSQAAALLGALIGVLALFGYAFGVSGLYAVSAFSSVAPHTAFAFVVANVGVLFARPRQGLMIVVSSHGAGGIMARRLLPFTLLAPFAIGLIADQGTESGWFSAEFGIALASLLFMGLFSALNWRTAALLRDSEQQRLVAQRNLEEQRAHLTAIVDSAADAIVGKTLDGRITSWNPAAQALFGYSAEEAIGKPVQMLLPPDREAEEMLILSELARGRSVPAFDTIRIARDKTPREVSVTVSPIRDAQGRVTGASKIARDVSHLRRAQAALRESDRRLRIALEAAQIGDWDLDMSSGVIHRSIRHDRCFGYEQLQPRWNFEIFLRHVHPLDRAEVEHIFNEAVIGWQDWHAECRVVWPDASVHWISVFGNPLREGAVPTRMLGIVTDVTQAKQAEQSRLTAQRLEAENRQIHEANQLKSRFLANMSHELRTPLNAIIGFSELLYTGTVPANSPKYHEFLGHIGTSGRHLLQLINDVLDLSKVESGKFEFNPEPVDLGLLINEVLTVLSTATERKRLTVTAQIDPALTGLQLDAARLKQALYNYVSNAIKFTPDDGQLAVRALPEGPTRFRIEVEDSGIGIAESDLPLLFTEFHQVDAGTNRVQEGTGLGLALTRRLVEAQGGSVGVRSLPGHGSVFHLVLDRVHGELKSPEPACVPAAAEPARRWLVIEDDQNDLARLVDGLSGPDMRVDTAATGQQALQQALDNAYDAITLDLQLPDGKGLDVLSGIRNHGPNHASQIVGMTMQSDAGSSAAFAIANVLSKPIHADEVAAAMARIQWPAGRRANVLVIDDDPMALAIMRLTLQGIGIDAICQLDGRTALHNIELYRPDAMILDLMMPEFDGFAVLDALRRLPLWQDLPVFIWTSMILTDDEYASLARSARAILNKGGGSFEAMLEALRRWRPPVPEVADRVLS